MHKSMKLKKKQILFKVIVNDSTIKSGAWKIIRVKELDEDLKQIVPFFMQEIGQPEVCWISWNGEEKRVDLQECLGLERLAVWDQIHVEKRLEDHYNGVLNMYTYALRPNDKWGVTDF